MAALSRYFITQVSNSVVPLVLNRLLPVLKTVRLANETENLPDDFIKVFICFFISLVLGSMLLNFLRP
jgi:hypothetical protein